MFVAFGEYQLTSIYITKVSMVTSHTNRHKCSIVEVILEGLSGHVAYSKDREGREIGECRI